MSRQIVVKFDDNSPVKMAVFKVDGGNHFAHLMPNGEIGVWVHKDMVEKIGCISTLEIVQSVGTGLIHTDPPGR